MHAKADVLAPLFCCDFVCLTETWLTEHDEQLSVPAYMCYSAHKPVCDRPGRPSGGVSVYVSDRLQTHVEFVKYAEDGSYLWLKLKRVVQGCPEVYSCVCYMPQKKLHKSCDAKTPHACLQDDILQFQGTGAEVLICGDMNARTAEEDDFIKLSELPECLDIPDEADDLPAYISSKAQQ